MRKVVPGVLALLLYACASNPYHRFYSGKTAASPEISGRITSQSSPPQIYSGTDQQQDYLHLLEDGYVPLGYAAFNGPIPPRWELLQQAKSIGAHLVILYGRFDRTVSGTTPLILPNPPTTAVTTVQGTATGPSGTVRYGGTATTTVPGGTSVYNMPYSVNRYEQFAGFWVKAKPPRLGVFYRPLNDSERRTLQRNGGVVVTAVVKSSPAFVANILTGDIVLRANDTDIQSPEQFTALLSSVPSPVVLDIRRGQESKQLTIQLADHP